MKINCGWALALLLVCAVSSGAQETTTGGGPTLVPAEPERLAVPGAEAVYGRLEPPAELWLALGSAYFRLNDVAAAERHYLAAVAAKPDLGEAHNNLAVICMLTGRLDDAVRAVERAGFGVRPGLKAELAARSDRVAIPGGSSR